MNNYITISMFTSKYQNYADDLMSDLKRLNIQHDIEGYPEQDDYIANHLLKPKHIQKMLHKLKVDIFWLDIDCRVHAPFNYIDNVFKGDIGAVMFANNRFGSRENHQTIPYPTMCTATMYLRNIQPIRDLVDIWVETLHPDKDAISLVQYDWNKIVLPAIEKGEITFDELPFEYCWVGSGDEKKQSLLKTTKPVIEQFYASEKFRGK